MVARLETLKAAALEADVAALDAAILADRAEAQRTATQRTADQAWKVYLAARVDAARAEQEAN